MLNARVLSTRLANRTRMNVNSILIALYDIDYKKPLFFDIALNYINLDMERLQERAGKAPEEVRTAAVAAPAPQAAVEKKTQVSRAKVEEIERAATPEPSAQARGGLGSLLGGWWGRR